MNNRRTLKLIGTLTLVTLLSACAGAVARQTSQDDRDTDGRYDGRWLVTVAKGAGIQYVNNWTIECGDMSNEFEIFIEDGTLRMKAKAGTSSAYVSKKGKFKIFVPITGEATTSSRSDTTLTSGERKLILSGNLANDKPVGILTYGIADLAWGGCTSKTRYKRLQPSV